jgi:hydrogenase maturation protease
MLRAPREKIRVVGQTIVVGCGSILRGDDGAGPVLVERLLARGLPPGVEAIDASTDGIGAVQQMAGADRVVLVDAAVGGGAPGTLLRLPEDRLHELPAVGGLDVHRLRWDQALALARAVLDDPPRSIEVVLVEAAGFEPGAALSPAVDRAVDRLLGILLAELATDPV